jgi:hypothetical protein
MADTKWKVSHSGFANTPFVIYAGNKAPDYNSSTPLQGVEVIAEVPFDEGPRHLNQERFSKMIAATMDMYTALRRIRSAVEGGDAEPHSIHAMADVAISQAEGQR